MATENDDDQILDLDALVPNRQTIVIGGTTYEIRSPAEVSTIDRIEAQQLWRKIERLEGKDHSTKADLTALAKAYDNAARLALHDCNDDDYSRLSDFAKEQIVGNFTLALRGSRMNLDAEGMTREAIQTALRDEIAKQTSES